MRARCICAVVLVMLLAAPALAQESSILAGPAAGHLATELTTAQGPLLVALAVDRFDAGPAADPSFVGSLEASQFVLELGPAVASRATRIGLGVRTWSSRLDGTQEYTRIYWTDATGREVDYEDAHDGYGALLPGYQEQSEIALRDATAEQDGTTEIALLASGTSGSGRLTGSWYASWAGSGIAWRVTGGVRLGEDVLASIGYRSWPMERFYRGPLLGLEFRF